jgi:hypothetical protein
MLFAGVVQLFAVLAEWLAAVAEGLVVSRDLASRSALVIIVVVVFLNGVKSRNE